MLGFVNSNAEKRQLGGEIFRETRRRRIITMSVIGVIAFVIFNAILYYLTRV
ncbi:MAG TPA: hypothetical protein VF941_22090 [Clostridia bacterium]